MTNGQIVIVALLTALTLAAPFLPVAYATKYSSKWYTPLVGDCTALSFGYIAEGGGILYDKDGNIIGSLDISFPPSTGSICAAGEVGPISRVISTYVKPYSWQISAVIFTSLGVLVESCPTTATGIGFPGTLTCDAGAYGTVTFTFLKPGH